MDLFGTRMLMYIDYVIALIALFAVVYFAIHKWWGGFRRALLTFVWFFLLPKLIEVCLLWPTEEGGRIESIGQMVALTVSFTGFACWWVMILRRRQMDSPKTASN